MIFRKPDEHQTVDKFSKAGADAERTMALYLRRAFGDDSGVSILNGIRLPFNEDAAQIDHLVIHGYGMIVVESKSVTGHVFVNERGEWTRQYQYLRGMPSPVKQAERQASFLVKYLDAHRHELPHPFVPGHNFRKMPVDVLVAISDSGIIHRPDSVTFDNVLKADLVPEKICKIIESHKKRAGFSGLPLVRFTLGGSARERISRFLIRANSPLFSEPTVKRQSNCIWCGSERLEIVWLHYGQFGYFFRCTDCHKNSPIHLFCPRCHDKLMLRPNNGDFYADCKSCGESTLFYTNRIPQLAA